MTAVTMPGDYSEELVEPSEQVYLDAATVDVDVEISRIEQVEPSWREDVIRRVARRSDFRAAVDSAFAAGQRAILDALSSSGRLVPEGSEVREEWGVRWPVVRTPNWPLETWGYRTRKVAETYATAYPQPDGVVLHRRVLTTPATPWTPSEPAQEER